jgi:hypothetical protein
MIYESHGLVWFSFISVFAIKSKEKETPVCMIGKSKCAWTCVQTNIESADQVYQLTFGTSQVTPTHCGLKQEPFIWLLIL